MIRGKLYAHAQDGKNIRVFFIQRIQKAGFTETQNVPVKVYRRKADDIKNFSYGMADTDYNKWIEYIDNQKIDDSRVQLIFDGTLPMKHSFCEYIDTNVDIGGIYIYWVTADSYGENVTIGPIGCKLRDPEVWWSYDRTVDEMESLSKEFPDEVEIEVFGESTMHRPIKGFKVGNKKKMIALTGAVHASEPGPELLIKAIRILLKDFPQLFEKVGLAVLPAINIDMRECTVLGEVYYIRKNPNGVDLNRNFNDNWGVDYRYGFDSSVPESSTYHGPFPESENETRAAVAFMNSVKPKALFSYDSCSVITEDRMLLDITADEDFLLYNCSNKVATAYSLAFRENNPGCGTFTAEPISFPGKNDTMGSGVAPNGCFEAWAARKFRIPSFSLQSAKSIEGSSNRDDQVTRELLERWSRRHAYAIKAVMSQLSDKNSFLE